MALDWFNTVFLYELGRDLQTLTQAAPTSLAAVSEPLLNAQIALDVLYTSRVLGKPLLPLPTSQRAYKSLKGVLDQIDKAVTKMTLETAAQPLDSRLLSDLTEKLAQFQIV
ncbi:MAG TPA: hypothetical protein VJX68_07620 [Candidatus Binatus sp.]|uniref:hypothetical protein n=1 Tax=Candidatus Binatus sp. TaxID=2811406 RepID=UPI002B47EF12|nr:hypothetical protein [Candidatus Binatus sp.]HKN13051.1 hypothetical protein [Candidatus Binatus sp.]